VHINQFLKSAPVPRLAPEINSNKDAHDTRAQ
jgi:hypothetical protein